MISIAATDAISFRHVQTLTDHIGIFEHAELAEPRRELGYCTDDVARLLIVLVREPDLDPSLRSTLRLAFRFLADGQNASGRMRNRCDVRGRWHDRAGVQDCWGRSVWAFGTAAAGADTEWLRAAALASFGHGVQERSPHLRSMVFAALGAAEVLRINNRHYRARELMNDAVVAIGPPSTDASWPWPEPRLAYANAAIAEVLIVGGELLSRPTVTDHGLALLDWLVARETIDHHLSPTPVGGAGPGDRAPRFDQQPIEVAAMADACAAALALTGDDRWQVALDRAVAWFHGENDLGVVMYDPVSGGGYDGLTPTGPNLNQGAESTLAMIATLQHGRLPAPSTVRPTPGFAWPARDVSPAPSTR